MSTVVWLASDGARFVTGDRRPGGRRFQRVLGRLTEADDRLESVAGADGDPGPGVDMVYCGAGIDHVLAEKKDKVAKDCEIVLRPDIEVPPPIEIPRRSPRCG